MALLPAQGSFTVEAVPALTECLALAGNARRVMTDAKAEVEAPEGKPRFSAVGLRTILQEVLGRTRAIREEVVPAPPDGAYEPTLPDLDDFDLADALGKGHRLGQAHGLAAVCFEDGRAGHESTSYVYPGAQSKSFRCAQVTQVMPSRTYELFRTAILERKQVVCTYRGFRREVCPHILGYTRGREMALTYQFAGQSASGLPPGGEWRCLSLAEVRDIRLRKGRWCTGTRHTRVQACVEIVDIDVNRLEEQERPRGSSRDGHARGS